MYDFTNPSLAISYGSCSRERPSRSHSTDKRSLEQLKALGRETRHKTHDSPPADFGLIEEPTPQAKATTKQDLKRKPKTEPKRPTSTRSRATATKKVTKATMAPAGRRAPSTAAKISPAASKKMAGKRKRSSKEVEEEPPQEDNTRSKRQKVAPKATSKEAVDKHGWTKTQTRALTKAFMMTEPTRRNFWKEISKQIPGGHTAEDCMHYYTDVLHRSPAKRKAVKGGKANKDEELAAEKPVKLAGKGTLKRKKQARAMLEAADQQHDDDIFGNTQTPHALRAGKPWLEDEDTPEMKGGCSNPNAEQEADDVDSPGVLRKVDRNSMDTYISKLRNGRGQPAKTAQKVAGKSSSNTVSVKKPRQKLIAKKAMVVHVPESPEGDAEDYTDHDAQLSGDAAYYWSDADN